jgi:hypothetical protein
MKTLIVLGTVACFVFILNSVFAIFGTPTIAHFESKNGLLKKHADSIHENATGLQHFEDFEDFEDFEALEAEYFEHAEKLKARGKSPQKAGEMAQLRMRGKYGKKFDTAMQKVASGSPNVSPISSSAVFDISVKRDTINIVGISLPVPLFGAIHFNARYNTIINQFLPAGITISGIAVNANGDVIITYFNGAVSDTVTISCNQIPYITFLDGSKLNAQRVSKTLYSISDVTQITQFNETFKTAYKTIYGKNGGNDLSLSSTNNPYITNFPVREVTQAYTLNYETCLILGIKAVAGFSVNLNMFIAKFERTNVNA